jgi:GntR family transcriptional regulator
MASALTGPVPLYFQLQEHLRDRINSGEFPPGALLPTEVQLCSQFGVSRITVGKALDGLLAEKLIHRRQGVGTFVSDHPPPAKSLRLTGWIDEMLAPAENHSSRVLKAGLRKPPAAILERLGLQDRAFCFEALYSAGRGVYSYSLVYMAADLGQRVAPRLAENEQVPIRIIETLLGQKVERAEQTITPVLPSATIAAHLGLTGRKPVLRVTRTHFLPGGRAISILDAWYHPERVRYSIELYPRPDETRR